MVGNRTLQKKYAEYNQKYFGGKLPVCPVDWQNLSRYGAIGRHRWFVIEGKGMDGRWREVRIEHTIHLDPMLKKMPNLKLSTLLHEMCHVAVRQQSVRAEAHGRLFQQEMLRLATAGAFKTLW